MKIRESGRRDEWVDSERDERPSAIVELQERAIHYASALVDGDEILDHVDGTYVGPFAYFLPHALARRGLCLDKIPGGYKVRAVVR